MYTIQYSYRCLLAGCVYLCGPHKGARSEAANAQVPVRSRLFARVNTTSIPCKQGSLSSHPLADAGVAGQPWQGGWGPCLGQGGFGPDAMETGPGARAQPRCEPDLSGGPPAGSGTVAAGDAGGVSGTPGSSLPPQRVFSNPAGACLCARSPLQLGGQPGKRPFPGTYHAVAAICSSGSGPGSLEKLRHQPVYAGIEKRQAELSRSLGSSLRSPRARSHLLEVLGLCSRAEGGGGEGLTRGWTFSRLPLRRPPVSTRPAPTSSSTASPT